MLALYAVCVFPANVHQALADVPVGGVRWPLMYHVIRLPLQPVIVWWALYAGGVIDWPFHEKGPPGRCRTAPIAGANRRSGEGHRSDASRRNGPRRETMRHWITSFQVVGRDPDSRPRADDCKPRRRRCPRRPDRTARPQGRAERLHQDAGRRARRRRATRALPVTRRPTSASTAGTTRLSMPTLRPPMRIGRPPRRTSPTGWSRARSART